ncbi:unnamed protein product [Protopolystoma xenopodis]|uniref:Uncharacterized protein n=1 Tax=Protopolystoma xenopodis TaxID=117903 RepID=A0A3S4ZJB0_9PLAT|nr:unnamed protein product [Protopolystoma xenopodis]
MTHQPRSWIARDACVDTSELRCFTGPIPQVLTICQPINMCFSHLTSIHLEKVNVEFSSGFLC